MRLIDADALKAEVNKKKVVGRFNTIMLIDNAPTVPNEYMRGYEAAEREYKRPQGELADEVWKLYKRHQSHLATHVYEFGDELKELLSKYQKGGAE